MKAIDVEYPIETIAFRLCVSEDTVKKWLRYGELKSLKGIDVLAFGFYHPEYKHVCEAILSYTDATLLHNKLRVEA